MRRKTILMVCVLALSLAVVGAAAAAPAWHRVRPGETLFSIGRLYNVSPWAIASANNLPNPDRILIGQQLYIPAGPPYYPPRQGRYYNVQIGDTLHAIGRRFGVSPWAIAAANRIYNLNYIYAGQVLYIP